MDVSRTLLCINYWVIDNIHSIRIHYTQTTDQCQTGLSPAITLTQTEHPMSNEESDPVL